MADTKDIQLTDTESPDPEKVTAKKSENDTSVLVDEPVHFPGFVAFNKRGCTDCLCLILFGLFLAGWMGLLGFGLAKGRPEVMYRATDYDGNVCGEFLSTTAKNNFFDDRSPIKDYKFGAMPRLVDDFLLMATSKTNGTRITTVCTDSCPVIGDIVCTYDFIKKLKDSTGPETGRKKYRSPLFKSNSTEKEEKEEYQKINDVLQVTAGYRRFVAAEDPLTMAAVQLACSGNTVAPPTYTPSKFGTTPAQEKKQFCMEAFQACDKTIMDSTSILGRCVPYLSKPKSRIIQRCVDPVDEKNKCNASDPRRASFTEESNPYCIKGQQAKYEPTKDADGNYMLLGKESELCAKMEEVTTSTLEVLPQSSMLKRMAALAASFSSYVVSVQRAWLPVLACGLLLALVLGFVFLILIKTFAGCIVWMSIILLEVCLIAGAILGLMKGGVIKDGVPTAFTAAVQQGGFSSEVNDDNKTYYQIGGYVLAFMAVAFVCVIIFVRRQINDAIRVVKISAMAVGSNPKIVLWPLFSFFWVGVSSVVFTIIAILLMSSGDMIANEATAFLNETALAETNLTSPSAFFPDVTTLKTDEIVKYFAIYDLFMWFWFNEFVQALGVFTIGGTVAEWYFTPKEYKRPVPEGQSCPRRICCPDTKHGVCGAFCISFKKHSGTAAFGSLIIAIVSTIRAVVTYIQMQVLAANKDSKLVKVVQCLIACCMKCVEKCAKYLTKNAFLYSSVKGTNLCVSAYKSFLLLWNNLVRFGATGMSSGAVMLFGKMFIMMLSVLAGYNWLNTDYYKDATSANYVSDMGQFVCCLVILFFSFIVSEVFFSVYDTATDTILISYCFDVDNSTGKAFEDKMGYPMPIKKNLEGDKAGKEEKDGERKPCCACGFMKKSEA